MMSRSHIFMLALCVLGIFVGATLAHAWFAPEEKQPTDFQNRLLRTYIYQNRTELPAGTILHEPFEIVVSEDSPSVTSAFIQVTGIAYGTTTQPNAEITLSIDDGSFSSPRSKTFKIKTKEKGRSFSLLYDISPYLAEQITDSGTYRFTFDVKMGDVVITPLSAELIVTYQYTPIKNNLMPISATVASNVFDTKTNIGAGYNALSWKGKLGGPAANEGRVRLQLATSHCANGAQNPPTCNAGGWEYFGGPTCATNDWFEPMSDTQVDLQSTGCIMKWNDRRYFRYRVQICSVDCSVAGLYSPEVDEVHVNWSP